MQLIPFIIKREQNEYFSSGWGNGYVAVPKEHPAFGEHYDDIEGSVHGGLTYSEPYNSEFHPIETKGMWIVGWDTAHSGDNLQRWPDEESIMKENSNLVTQLQELANPKPPTNALSAIHAIALKKGIAAEEIESVMLEGKSNDDTIQWQYKTVHLNEWITFKTP